MSKFVHSFDDENFYLNLRNGGDYEANRVDINDVYLIERHYRIKQDFTKIIAVLFILSGRLTYAEAEFLYLHKNTYSFAKPHIRTSPDLLTDEDRDEKSNK